MPLRSEKVKNLIMVETRQNLKNKRIDFRSQREELENFSRIKLIKIKKISAVPALLGWTKSKGSKATPYSKYRSHHARTSSGQILKASKFEVQMVKYYQNK